MTVKTLELQERLLAGDELLPDELDALLTEKVPEDLHLEYKHGDVLDEGKKANFTVRKYLSGFANSEGGVLIIGLDQKKWQITGCKAPGGGDLREWASRALTPISAYFSPVPRFQVVQHRNGKVLVCVTDRSISLVPIQAASKLDHYFRLHDQTLQAPDYLIRDIVLGRRQKPYLNITTLRLYLKANEYSYPNGWDGRNISIQLEFTVENEGLVWADDVRLGVIGWAFSKPYKINRLLFTYFDIYKISNIFNLPDFEKMFNPVHTSAEGSPLTLGPFDQIQYHGGGSFSIPMRVLNQWAWCNWKAAVYLLSKEAPPIWYQLSLFINNKMLQFANNNETLQQEGDLYNITRLSNTRPIVAWEKIPE